MDSEAKGRREKIWIDWDIIEVMVSGKSAIDLPRLHVDTEEKAKAFAKAYGFDLDDPEQKEEAEKILAKAKDFAKNTLAADPEFKSPPLVMPKSVEMETDIVKLMIMASVRSDYESLWACAALKLCHTITHIDNHFSSFWFPIIQEQVTDNFERRIFTAPNGFKYLGTSERGIRLYDFEVKSKKPFESTALKLLHKADSATADIFDRIGVRFVTYTKLDAMLAIKYLIDRNIVVFPNVKASRSRNTLLNMEYVKSELDKFVPLYNNEAITIQELMSLAHLTSEAEQAKVKIKEVDLRERNAFSSASYSSMQFTVRQLITAKLAGADDPNLDEEARKQKIFRFYFPYEIQILDRESYIESRKGRASHEEYKRQQLIAARKRVFGALLNGVRR